MTMTEQLRKAKSSIKHLDLKGVLGAKFGLTFDKHGFTVCPFHNDSKPSLHVRETADGNWKWRCFGCGRSGDYLDFRMLRDGIGFREALRLICSEEHFDLDAGQPLPRQADSAIIFTYTDTKGNPLYRVKKCPPKQFYFERYSQGTWLPKLEGVARTLYNLPDLLDAKEVFLLEGEKDCETLKKLGLVATTMGSKNSWKRDFASFFKGKDVRVCLDEGNEADAERIAKDIDAVATAVRILKLPGLTEKEQDITDWFERMDGQSDEEKVARLAKVVSETPVLDKSPSSSPAPLAESILEFRARPAKKRDVFMRYWLEREGLTFLAGEHKTGKSVLAMNLAICVATGRGFLGFEVPSPRKVLLVQQEISDPAMHDRVDKMIVSPPPELQQNLLIPRRPEQYWKVTRVQDRDLLGKIIQDCGIDLVIFDPLSTFHDKKENDNGEMSGILEYFAQLIKKHSVGVLVIHHFGKPSQVDRQGSYKMRGASVLGDRPDAIIVSTRLPEKYKQTPFPQPFDNYAQLTFKLRNDEEPESFVIERDSETLWYSRYELPGYLGRKIPPTMVVEIVKMNGGSCPQAEVQKALEGFASHRIVFEAINEARKLGLVKAQPLPGKGSPLILVVPENREAQGALHQGVA